MNLRSSLSSLTSSNPLNTNNHKESVMNLFRTLSLLALFVLAPVSAFAASDNMNVNITVTVTATNAVEWTQADNTAPTPLVTGARTWTIAGATVNTAYLSRSNGTVTGPVAVGITDPITSLHFTNRGNISVTSSITVAGGNWGPGGAAALDTFLLKASVTGTAPYGITVGVGAQTLDATQAKDANCALALQFTTPTGISSTTKVSSTQVVTITCAQN